MAAFENEFYLAHVVDGRVEPWQDGPCYSSAGMDRVADVMDDIVDALEAQGLEVEQAINEYGPGQQEIAIRYGDGAASRRQPDASSATRCAGWPRCARAHRSFAAKPFARRASAPVRTSTSASGRPTGRATSCTTPDAGDRLLSDARPPVRGRGAGSTCRPWWR